MIDPADPMTSTGEVDCEARLAEAGVIEGYAFIPAQLGRRLTVELLFDGVVVATLRADEFVESLWRAHRGDGCYGFSFAMPVPFVAGIWEVRLANSDRTLVRLEHQSADVAPLGPLGQVRWYGGLRIVGFVANEEEGVAITCACDGQLIHQGRADGWTHVQRGGQYHAVRAFDFHLPLECADGVPKSVRVYGASGVEFAGSPVELVAFPDPLRQALLDRIGSTGTDARLRVFDRLFPQSMPLDEWPVWLEHWMPREETGGESPSLAVVILGDQTEPLARTVASLEGQTRAGWIAAALPISEQGTFRNEDLVSYLNGAAAEAEAVFFVKGGIELEGGALARLAAALAAAPEAGLLYPDLCQQVGPGQREPGGYGAFDRERFLEQGYFGAAFVVRRASLILPPEADEISVFDIVFRFIETDGGGRSVAHLPGSIGWIDQHDSDAALACAVGLHLQRRNVPHSLELQRGGAQPRIRVRRHPPLPDLSIVLCWRGEAGALEASITSLRRDPRSQNVPILVVSHGAAAPPSWSSDPTIAFLSGGGEFQRHRLANIALKRVETEFVLLLDADMSAVTAEWMEELAGRMWDADVAAVTGVTIGPQDHVAHAGYVLGTHYAVGEAFVGAGVDECVYGDLLRVAREAAAISLRGALLRTSMVTETGFFDEGLYPEALRDVDLCLRCQERGWRLLVTPYVRFRDCRPQTLDVTQLAQRHPLSLARFRSRWRLDLLSDALYSPVLGLDGAPYSSLAWPPRDLAVRARFQRRSAL